MTRLYFTANKTDWGRLHWARIGDLFFLIYQSAYGLCGRVSDVSKPQPFVHDIDWRGTKVHPDEMKKKLQSWADENAS